MCFVNRAGRPAMFSVVTSVVYNKSFVSVLSSNDEFFSGEVQTACRCASQTTSVCSKFLLSIYLYILYKLLPLLDLPDVITVSRAVPYFKIVINETPWQ